MKLTHIGHAGWLFESGKIKLLCDPWLNPDGAYFGGWFQFPSNEHLLQTNLFDDITHLYISHRHDDHFDKWFLNKLNKNVKVIIPKFKDKRLRNDVREIGFKKVFELTEENEITDEHLTLKIIPDEGYLDRDSALLVKTNTSTFLNLNDCHLPFELLKEKVGDVDVLLMQASSAIWWPYSYDYDTETQKIHSKKKRNNVLKRALKYIKILKPKMVIPNAGPPIFLNERFKEIIEDRGEDHNAFPMNDEINSFFLENNVNSILMNPGDSISYPYKEIEKHNFDIHPYDQYLEYVEMMREKKSFMGDNYLSHKHKITNQEIKSVPSLFAEKIRQMQKKSLTFFDKLQSNVLFKFYGLEQQVCVDFNSNPCVVEKRDSYDYEFTFNPIKVALMFRHNDIDFDDYLLGLDFKAARNPDTYNELLFTILKNFSPKRLRIAESLYNEANKNSNEFIVVEDNGKQFECQRYCPHMGADLKEHGIVKDGKIICPLHGWAFDLETGITNNSKTCRLKTQKK